VYVYTERPSGAGLSWDVFVSRDNLEWELREGAPAVVFDLASSRYEISFPTASTRYVKVVNAGANEQPEVLVTELEAFTEAQGEGEVTRRGGGHRLDVGADYDVTERIGSSLDASFESVPFSGTGGEEDRADYTLQGRYRQSSLVLHHVKWQQGFHSFAGGAVDERTDAPSYTLLVEPLETLRFTTSLDARLDWRNGEKTDGFRGVVFRVSGNPVRNANVSGDVSRSRNEQHDLDRHHDVWAFRVSADGAVSRGLDAVLNWSHQRITTQPEDELRLQDQYGVGFDYRVTRTIFARGSWNLTRELGDEVTQDYLLSWNAAPKLSLGGQASFIRTRQGGNTERYAANLTYNLSAGSALYSSYTVSDFTEVGGTDTVSLQAGLRVGV
jgi:hypothetical protein